MLKLCLKTINSRSKYDGIVQKRCHLPHGHKGRCDEFPFLRHFYEMDKSVADKIKRDSTMTTGAAWKSEDAGPNRILRWVMLLSDEELKNFGLDMSKLKPGIIAKLREKAADYDSCIEVALKLTWLVYQMEDAPQPPRAIREYLEGFFGQMDFGSTVCEVCKLPISFKLFELAQRGKAEIETCHKNPRLHNAENVGFAHRECNIAQGAKTLDDFYEWIEGILERSGH
ncbi:MAG: hypothetical protein C4589_07555 [Peptococcaceae bacterium]|nr:MAG: hypothetical protein C4589_07555 [Peptococcaceae bacterium]